MRGIEYPSKQERFLTSHMDLKSTKSVLKVQDLSEVQNIVLIHLSEPDSDKNLFAYQVSALTEKPVKVACGGLKIDLSNLPC